MVRVTHSHVLQGVAAAYTVYFWSLYCQLPQLFGFDGLQPAAPFLSRVRQQLSSSASSSSSSSSVFLRFPSLLLFAGDVGAPLDALMDVLALGGAVLSAVAVVTPAARCSFVFGALFLAYHSLYLVGQSFLSFQWDSLLLEIGFVAVWYAPLVPSTWRRARGWVPSLALPAHPFQWVTRVLLFKLMFMAGAVKIQAQCPTWLRLTALEYHYATQPIATPASWLFHQLPPAVHAACVAAALVIELPATVLLLMPLRTMAVVGAMLQVALQFLIFVTGNYNAFNLLTALMAVAVVAHPVPADDAASNAASSSDGARDPSGDDEAEEQPTNPPAEPRSFFASASTPVQLVLCAALLVASVVGMFRWPAGRPADTPWWLSFSPELAFTVPEFNAALDRVLLPFAAAAAVGVVCHGAVFVVKAAASNNDDTAVPSGRVRTLRRVSRTLWAAATAVMAAALLCATVRPLVMLRPELTAELPSVVHDVSDAFRSRNWHVASGYGLFRRMTGMGADGTDEWGLPVPVVARPEVVLEGSVDGGVSWAELEVAYKPGDVTVAPPLVAPHQPRVAWQMWFAALANYQSAGWVVTLADKLLEGSPAAMAALDARAYPFKAHDGALTPPSLIRAALYTYDFTRWKSAWAPRAVHAAPYNVSEAMDTSAWWVRRRVGEWLPAVPRGEASVATFRQHHGAPRLAPEQRQAATAALQACPFSADAGREVWFGPVGLRLAWAGWAVCCAAAVARQHPTILLAATLAGLAGVAVAGSRFAVGFRQRWRRGAAAQTGSKQKTE